MQSVIKIVIDLIIVLAIIFTSVYLYRVYSDDIRSFFLQNENVVIFIDNLAVGVKLADDPEERRQGLSGVASLGDLKGMLFVFDREGYHKIWMKDMLIPLDIIFINNDFEIVHIAEDVQPDTYPKTFTSPRPARFVLEVNAFFSDSFEVHVGQRVSIPPRILPGDLRESLR